MSNPRLEFGLRLRQLRDNAGLQAKQVAEQIGISGDLASRYELGQRWPRPEHLHKWALAVGLDSDAADALVSDLEGVRRQDREVRAGAKYGPKASQVEHSRRFANASRIRTLAVTGIPFYLQTDEYARQQLGENPAAAEIAAMRQADFKAVGGPGKDFRVILVESALRLLPCERPAMVEQLGRLMRVLDTKRVELGIIAFGMPVRTPIRGSFSLFDDIPVLDMATGEATLTPKDAKTYSDLLDDLWSEGWRGDDARDILTAATRAITDS